MEDLKQSWPLILVLFALPLFIPMSIGLAKAVDWLFTKFPRGR